MSKIVLDSSAVLAYLLEERGADLVTIVLESGNGILSSVNYAEVVSKLMDYQMPSAAIQMALDDLELTIKPFDVQQAFLVGELRFVGKPLGLSLGDRACLALAKILQLPLLTADRNWQQLDIGVEIRLLRD